jgi:hypothetical protein
MIIQDESGDGSGMGVDPAPQTHTVGLAALETKYLALAKEVVKGNGYTDHATRLAYDAWTARAALTTEGQP